MEKLTWRTRAYIMSVAPLSTKEFMVGDFRVITRPELVGQLQKGVHIVDVILNDLAEPSAEEAHIIGLDTLEVFLDRISVVAYGPCHLLKVISTCPTEVQVSAQFNMVTEDLMMNVTSPEIEPENIAAFNELPEDSPARYASHLIRQALSAGTVEQHLLYLHNAIERIATNESGERVVNKCPSCEHTWDGPVASRRAVRAVLLGYGVSRKDADDAVEYRGRIAHGGGKRNVAFNNRVTELAGAIEGAVVSTAAQRAGVTVMRRHGVVVGLPMTLHKAVKNEDGSFDLISTSWKAPIRFPKLSEDNSQSQGSALAGMPFRSDGAPEIDPVAWPS